MYTLSSTPTSPLPVLLSLRHRCRVVFVVLTVVRIDSTAPNLSLPPSSVPHHLLLLAHSHTLAEPSAQCDVGGAHSYGAMAAVCDFGMGSRTLWDCCTRGLIDAGPHVIRRVRALHCGTTARLTLQGQVKPAGPVYFPI